MSEERERAAGRLDAAQAERRRVVERLETASGAVDEMHAAAEVRHADGQVAAHEAWIEQLERYESERG